MYRSTHKESNKTGFSFLQIFLKNLKFQLIICIKGENRKGKLFCIGDPGVLSN